MCLPTIAEDQQARFSPVVMGLHSLSVPGLGIGILDMFLHRVGTILVARVIHMRSTSALNHWGLSLPKMLIVYCRCLLLVW